MEVEKSVAVIVFRKEDDFKFLLLWKKNSGVYKEAWEFPKGNTEKGETETQTGLRELQEESGLTEKDIQFYDFHDKVSFFYRRENHELVRKEVSFLLARTNKSDVRISSEHDAYRWAGYLEAFDLLTHKNAKEILRKAYDQLKKKFAQKTIF
jgi:8-oxo-dGTP pyrophosphatase MutT (NUDIX family)